MYGRRKKQITHYHHFCWNLNCCYCYVYFVFDDLYLAEYNNDVNENEDDVRAEVYDRVPSSVELEYFGTILESPVYLILEHIR
jgi:hypothetical protein